MDDLDRYVVRNVGRCMVVFVTCPMLLFSGYYADLDASHRRQTNHSVLLEMTEAVTRHQVRPIKTYKKTCNVINKCITARNQGLGLPTFDLYQLSLDILKKDSKCSLFVPKPGSELRPKPDNPSLIAPYLPIVTGVKNYVTDLKKEVSIDDRWQRPSNHYFKVCEFMRDIYKVSDDVSVGSVSALCIHIQVGLRCQARNRSASDQKYGNTDGSGNENSNGKAGNKTFGAATGPANLKTGSRTDDDSPRPIETIIMNKPSKNSPSCPAEMFNNFQDDVLNLMADEDLDYEPEWNEFSESESMKPKSFFELEGTY